MQYDINVIAEGLKRAKPHPHQGNNLGTYTAAIGEWNTTVTLVAKSLAESNPEFKREEFYFATGYWSKEDSW